MKSIFAAALAASLLMSGGAAAKTKAKAVKGAALPGVLILYSEPNFNGDRYELSKARTQLSMEWNIRSIAVAPGESWEICEKPRYRAPCMTLGQSYANSGEVGVTGMIGSVRPAGAGPTAAKK